ncbi:MAG: SMP-30/gluconolactonase/LRE family protein [Marinilabilia sp.]
MKSLLTLLALLLPFIVAGQTTGDDDVLYESYDVTPDSLFLPWAEGPAVDPEGVLYSVNYERKGTIGYVRPDGSHGLFVNLPEGSTGNGIRLWKDKVLLVADYTGHKILSVRLSDQSIGVVAHEEEMNQPNDLAITSGGIIYASDPNWDTGEGSIWMADLNGNMMLLEKDMGTTNGIEVSPSEDLLYVNESNNRNVWVFDILDDGSIDNKRLLIDFDDHGLDGMRCDEEGNLYITRMDRGTVVIVSPGGEVLHEIPLKGDKPTNVAFGGEDGRTVFVTVADRGAIEAFRTEFAGRSFRMSEAW